MKLIVIRMSAALVALGMLVGCGGASTPTPTASVSVPTVFFLAEPGKQPLPGQAGSWCWDGKCVDAGAPTISNFTKLTSNSIAIRTKPPTPNKFELTLRGSDGKGDALANTEIVPDGDTVEWTPDVAAGDYVLAVQGKWNDGSDITYYFGVSLPGK